MHIISAVLHIVYRACINVHVSSGGFAIYTYHSCTEVYRAEFKMEKVGNTGSNSSAHPSTTAHLLT